MSRSVCFPDSCGPAEGGKGEPSQLFCLWSALQVGGGLGPPGCPRHTPEAAPEAAHLKLGMGAALCSGPREPGQSSRVRLRCSQALRTCRVKCERLLVQLVYLPQPHLPEAQPNPPPSSLSSSLPFLSSAQHTHVTSLFPSFEKKSLQ